MLIVALVIDAAKAIQSGAFGGSREGIQRAERDRGLQQVKADTLSKLLSSNFAQAQKASGCEGADRRHREGQAPDTV